VARQAFDPDERFRTMLTPEQQIKVLGPGKWQLWKDGKITLADLVTHTTHPVHGPGLRPTTLAELQARGVESKPVIDRTAGR
jgi:hypothetical protein